MSTGWSLVVGAIAVLTVTNTVILVGLLKRHEAVLARAEEAGTTARTGGVLMGLEPGAAVGSFRAHDARGVTVTDRDLTANAPCLVVLLEPGCAACENIMNELVVTPSRAGLPVAIVLPDTTESHARDLDGRATWTLYQHDDEVSLAFGAQITPLAFVLDRSGEILARHVPAVLQDVWRLAEPGHAAQIHSVGQRPS